MLQKKIGIFFRRVGIGFLVGIGAVAPGISGGAIAVIFGLYQEITGALAHLFGDFRRSFSLLFPLGIGGILSLFACGHLLDFFFTAYPVMTRCVFIGLMLGTLPSVTQDACRNGFRVWYPLLAVLSLFVTVFGVKFFPFTFETTPLSVPLLLLCGIIIAIGTIVPGISTSFSLMALGLYDRLLTLFTRGNLIDLWPIVVGFVLFVLLFSKAVDSLYRKAYGVMSFLVVGLLLGSMVEVFPNDLFAGAHLGGWMVMLGCTVLSCFTLHLFSVKTKQAQ